MIRLKILVGMNYEYITISKEKYQKLLDFGNLKTDEEIKVITESGYIVTSTMIDSFQEVA